MNIGTAVVLAVTLLKAWTCARQLRCLAATGQPAYASAVVRLRLFLALSQGAAAIAALLWLRAQPPHAAWWLAAAVPGIVCLSASIDLAGAAFKSFLLDRKFGHNRATLRLFLGDAVQLLALRGGAALALALLALALMAATKSGWPPLFAVLVVALAWLSATLYPRWIEPMRLHYGPLPSGNLRQRLLQCLRRCGFEHVRLVVEPGSVRSTHANAKAQLPGPRGRVVLLDTLLQCLPPEQVEAVLAHELGHLAGRHLQRRFGWLCAVWACAFAAAVLIATDGSGLGDWNRWAAVPVLLPPLRFLLQPWLNRRLRRWELEADAFAARHVPPAVLGATLEALFRVNAAASRSDPWFAAFHESHPPLPQRLASLAAA